MKLQWSVSRALVWLSRHYPPEDLKRKITIVCILFGWGRGGGVEGGGWRKGLRATRASLRWPDPYCQYRKYWTFLWWKQIDVLKLPSSIRSFNFFDKIFSILISSISGTFPKNGKMVLFKCSKILPTKALHFILKQENKKTRKQENNNNNNNNNKQTI